jgi:hypothetical protein
MRGGWTNDPPPSNTVVDQALSADPAASTRDNGPAAGLVGELEGPEDGNRTDDNAVSVRLAAVPGSWAGRTRISASATGQ